MSVICFGVGIDHALANFCKRSKLKEGGLNVTCDLRIDVYLFC